MKGSATLQQVNNVIILSVFSIRDACPLTQVMVHWKNITQEVWDTGSELTLIARGPEHSHDLFLEWKLMAARKWIENWLKSSSQWDHWVCESTHSSFLQILSMWLKLIQWEVGVTPHWVLDWLGNSYQSGEAQLEITETNSMWPR